METIQEARQFMNASVDLDDHMFYLIVNDNHTINCELFYNKCEEQDYYTIIYENTVIGGFNVKDNGLIRGNINLVDFTDEEYKTCIIVQLAREPKPILFMPKKPKSKYDPHQSNFVEKSNYEKK